MIERRYLSPEQVCELVPVLTPRDLEDMRSNNTGPAYVRPTRRKVVYFEADIHAWLALMRVGTRDQP